MTEPLGLKTIPPNDLDLFRRAFGETPYVPEGRATFDALVPDRFKREIAKENGTLSPSEDSPLSAHKDHP